METDNTSTMSSILALIVASIYVSKHPLSVKQTL
jgi:hypothetical protein